MKICRLNNENMNKAASVFGYWQETIIWSALSGYMGSVWADSSDSPVSVRAVNGDFCFLAGEPMEELVLNKPQEHSSDFIIMVPENMEWGKLIEHVHGKYAVKVTRYATKKEMDIFNIEKLTELADSLNHEFEVRLIDEEIYHQIKTLEWAGDLCSNFNSYEEYSKMGIGAAVLNNGNIISGASSYTVYPNGIEIEVDTHEDYRRRGFASVCSAKLILECLKRNKYPSWDAQNRFSLALAEKLGYTFDHEYTAYEVTDWKV